MLPIEIVVRKTVMKKIFFLGLPVLLSGCVAPGEVKDQVVEHTATVQKGPDTAPQKNYTNMQESLRCMDRLFLENGVRDLVVLTEDIVDNTKKLPVGARDMLTSAVSDMTRRSRAIRLITFGGDVVNLVNWLNASGTNNRVYTFKPDFDIRGSISQMDDNLIQGRAGGGFDIGPIGGGKTKDASAAVLGLDMSIISTQTMELLPGVTSRNSIVVMKEGQGTDASVSGRIAKQRFGINYDFSFNRNEGSAQAVRTLIELATIELFGKLTRTPYWSCLGVEENHPIVRDEIGDWYHNLLHEGKLLPYVQNQLRIRGVYKGPTDGSVTKELIDVIPKARKALGLSEFGDIDEPFFAGLVNLRSKTLGAPTQTVAHLSLAQLSKKKSKKRSLSPTATGASVPPGDFVSDAAYLDDLEKVRPLQVTGKAVKAGEIVNVAVLAKDSSFAYCFYQEAPDQWMRIFPNRFMSDPLIPRGKKIDLPGNDKVQIKAGAKDQKESLACFSTSADISMHLSPEVRGGDFEPNPGLTLRRLRQEFATVSGDTYAEVIHEIRKR